jgi:hypothetical protein
MVEDIKSIGGNDIAVKGNLSNMIGKKNHHPCIKGIFGRWLCFNLKNGSLKYQIAIGCKNHNL